MLLQLSMHRIMLQMMKPSSNPPYIVAVDAPSGWHVENGDESGQS